MRGHPDPCVRTRVLGRVVERVGQDLAHQHLVGEDRWQVGRDVDLDPSIAECRSGTADSLVDGVPDGHRDHVRPELPRFDPAHVEQIRDQAIEPLGFMVDRRRDLAPVFGRPLDVRVHQGPRGGPDRRERGPQVVRDRIEQGRLERVAPAGDLGRRRLATEPFALERPADLIGGSRQHALLALIGVAEGARPDQPYGAQGLVRRGDPDAICVGQLRLARLHVAPRGVDAHPL